MANCCGKRGAVAAMSKTCKDCMYCSLEVSDKVYCSGMPWHYPFGGSDTTTLDKEACKYFLERDKPTIFDHIIASEETLAEKLVFPLADGWWMSSIIDDGTRFATREKAFSATVDALKKEHK